MVTYPPARAHAGSGHDDGPAAYMIDGNGCRRFAGKVQSRQVEGIPPCTKQFGGLRVIALRVAFEYLGSRYRHR